MPFEGALEGLRGPVHELGIDAQLKRVSQVLVINEFVRLQKGKFNGVLATLDLSFNQDEY
jgi:hypothetical protein